MSGACIYDMEFYENGYSSAIEMVMSEISCIHLTIVSFRV